MSRVVLHILILGFFFSITSMANAQAPAPATTQELKRMSLAELLDIQVTTV